MDNFNIFKNISMPKTMQVTSKNLPKLIED